jgi:hypothetical protein
MACFPLPDRHNIAMLELRALPPFVSSEPVYTLKPLVEHLKNILETFGRGHPPAIQLPSVIALATFYHCDILDLLESLSLLREYRYDYLMKGLDLPVVLVDPLSRLRRDRVALRRTASAIRRSREGRPVFPNYPL